MRFSKVSSVAPVVFVLLTFFCMQGQGVRERRADLVLPLSGLVFTDHLLFAQNVASRLACANLCLATDNCEAFTHRAVSSTVRVCRGHSVKMTAASPHEVSPETQLYEFRGDDEITSLAETTAEMSTLAETTVQAEWLNTGCTWDAECTEANTRCFVNQCMCIQGYFYSVGTKTCSETCGQLVNSYLHYVNSGMYNNNVRQYDGYTLQKCLDDCSGDSACLNVEYEVGGAQCLVQHVTARDAPSDWSETAMGWHFYQRNCQ